VVLCLLVGAEEMYKTSGKERKENEGKKIKWESEDEKAEIK